MIIISEYGAKTTNADNTAIIQNCINACELSGGGIVYIPAGEFKYSALTMKSNVTLKGFGFGASVLKAIDSVNPNILCSGISGWNIKDVHLKGLATVSYPNAYPTVTDTGIALRVTSGCKEFNVDSCKISLYGTGIDYQSNLDVANKGIFSKIVIEDTYKAIYTSNSGEYANFTDVLISKCTFGIHVDSGNNLFTGCQVVRTGVACKLSGGTNNGHGSFVGCTFNHNNYNLDIYEAVSVGESFVGCNFIADITNFGNSGRMRIMNSRGVNFSNCHIGSNIVVDGGSGTISGANIFNGCLIRTELSGYAAPSVLNGGIVYFKNNIDFNGLFSGNN